MKERKLVFHGGQGCDYSDENGKFEVKADETKTFYKLSEAKKYYDSLEQEKALWDLTSIPELLECHTFQ